MFSQIKICFVVAAVLVILSTLQTIVQAKQKVRVRGRPRSDLRTFSAVPESDVPEPATTSTARRGECPEKEGLQVTLLKLRFWIFLDLNGVLCCIVFE